MIKIQDTVFSKVSSDVVFEIPNQELLKLPLVGEALNNYLLISNYPEKFEDVSALDLYYNKYYWYLKFSITYQDKYGYDAGIEQQEFKLIEEGESIPYIDWREVESISKELKNII